MRTHHKQCDPNYIHHKNGRLIKNMREVVFGMQDGMVSTLGAITGIAIGSYDHFVVLLSGVAIIAVESISMGIGSYTSSRSEKKLEQRILYEEHEEIHAFPQEEAEELHGLFMEGGWSYELAGKMVDEATDKKHLMLREMMYRELKIIPDGDGKPAVDGIFMFFAYILGGLIPLFSYFVLPLDIAIKVSIPITLVGLFALGALISKFTKERWYITGGHMLFFGGVALIVGYLVGYFSKYF